MDKLKLIWHILRAENYSVILKLKNGRGGAAIIKAPTKDAKAHLFLHIGALKESGIIKDDAEALGADNKNED